MAPDKRTTSRWMAGAALTLAVAFAPPGATAESRNLNLHLVKCPTGTGERACHTDSTLQTAVKESAEKNQMKVGPGVKELLRDVRPGSCKSTAPAPPNTSWPARNEAAIAFCRP